MDKRTKALQYYRTGHFLETINPLSKFTVLSCFSAFVFISGSVYSPIVVFISCGIIFFLSPFRFFEFQGSRILFVTTMFIAILQILFLEQGNVLVTLPFLRITDLGLINAIRASLRFISIILLSYLFVLTTDPGSFVASLVQLGLPYRYGYTLITAMRMIPMIKSEVNKISYAQITRGVKYSLFPINKLISNINRFFKVVLIAMIKRVNQLVISMEGRSFGLYPKKTTLNQITFNRLDYLVIFLSLLLIPISFLWR